MKIRQERQASISLVMPNRNHGEYLPQSIGGLLAQMRPADEILIIDDASTDDSVAIIERIAADHPSIRLIKQRERAGVVANLNLGLSEAKGEFIAFPGADDLIFPAFLQESARLLEQFPESGFAAACAEIWDGADNVRGIRPAIMPSIKPAHISAVRFRRMLAGADNFFLGATTLYRRAALAEIGGFDAALGSTTDGMAARRIAARHGFCFCPRPLGMWRIHGGNFSISMASSPEAFAQMTKRIDEVLRAEPEGLFPPDYAAQLIRRLQFGVGRLMTIDSDLTDANIRLRLGALAGGAPADSLLLELAGHLGTIGRYIALAWLAVRLRPFSLWRLGIEPLRRGFREY